MKGSVFSLFEAFVIANYGEDTYDDILATTQLETAGPFVGPGIYPASDLLALVRTATDMLGITPEAALRAFGRHALPSLARSVPELMEAAGTPREFLMRLESVVHTEVRKLDPAASPPRLTVTSDSEADLTLHYESPFGLFSLVEGFLDGVGDWYGVPLSHELISTEGTNGTFRIRFDGADDHVTSLTNTGAGTRG